MGTMMTKVKGLVWGGIAAVVMMGAVASVSADTIQVLNPVAGASYKLGDSLTFKFAYQHDNDGVQIRLSVNAGIKYLFLFPTKYVGTTDTQLVGYRIPKDSTRWISTQAIIRVEPYSSQSSHVAGQSGLFSITPASSSILNHPAVKPAPGISARSIGHTVDLKGKAVVGEAGSTAAGSGVLIEKTKQSNRTHITVR